MKSDVNITSMTLLTKRWRRVTTFLKIFFRAAAKISLKFWYLAPWNSISDQICTLLILIFVEICRNIPINIKKIDLSFKNSGLWKIIRGYTYFSRPAQKFPGTWSPWWRWQGSGAICTLLTARKLLNISRIRNGSILYGIKDWRQVASDAFACIYVTASVRFIVSPFFESRRQRKMAARFFLQVHHLAKEVLLWTCLLNAV